MAYFWVNEAQQYLQGPGFGSELPGANHRMQPVRINQWAADNSFLTDKKAEIRLGKGGVDNAEDTEDTEDTEVVVHEYGHAVHHAQAPGFASSMETGSIGEALGDYPAVAVDEHAAPPYGRPLKADVACVACAADWDSVTHSNAPHCLHRINSDQTHADRISKVHTDSEIWSRAPPDIHTTPGPRIADQITVNAQFGFSPDTSFTAAAQTTVATTQKKHGKTTANPARTALQTQAIPRPTRHPALTSHTALNSHTTTRSRPAHCPQNRGRPGRRPQNGRGE
ncbi:hypothetical protein PGH47_00015 [Streptomyces sp. HUAS 31]|uniref:hypothetical protein n=1 Tax=Streptomyces sp. HUAS 31 TaxID=3020055 RepID=UPI0023064260|nr:hypothetical protein [Streptomyces sp. HUAS 31]WCD94132.1 hypothetical protein PGH47_00015 [Streptomyces sp. HUAS 31]